MKLITKSLRLHFSYALAFACSTMLHAADIIKVGSQTAFNGSIGYKTRVLDRYSGTLYVATDNAESTSSLESYRISSVARNALAATPLATNLAPAALISNIALIKPTLQAATILAFTRSDATGVTDANANQVVWTMPLSGTGALTPVQTSFLTDAASDTTAKVSLIATSSQHIFARVWKSGATTDSTNAGIANLQLNADGSTFSILQGSLTVPAISLDQNSTVLKPGGTGISPTGFAVNDMVWDEDLKTLYVGGTAAVAAGGGGIGIAKATLDPATGLLAINPIISSAITSATNNQTAIFMSTTSTETQTLAINKIKVMTTSTGYKYLIMNGGIGNNTVANDISGNEVWALRLAQTSGTNFSQGDIISNNSVSESALPTGFQGLKTLISAEVGARSLDLDTTVSVSDMQVVGDAVFVSVVTTRAQGAVSDLVADPGIFVSRAMFSEDGIIVAWTPWQRAYPSINNAAIITPSVSDDSATFFQVDGATGKIWKGRSDGRGIYRSAWLIGANAITDGLQLALNTTLNDGCFCMLDLPNGTPGLGVPNDDRNAFALFGGNEKVVFVRTQSGGHNDFAVTTTGTGVFADPGTNFLTTAEGLSGAGPIRCLGYGYRQDIGGPSNGYFFAGTNGGLYAYANSNDGTGFDTSAALINLTTSPFDMGSWQKIRSDVIGDAAISSIITGSNNVYFTTIDTTSTGSNLDQLYSIALATPDNAPTDYTVTVDDMNPILKAQSGFGGLPANAVFTGFALVTNDTYNGFFGVLSTNNGVYTTSCDLRDLVQSNVATVAGTQQEWQQVPYTNGIQFFRVYPYKDMRFAFDVNDTAISNANAYGTGATPTALTARPYIQQNRSRSFEAFYLSDPQNLSLYNRMRIFQGGSHGPASRTNASAGLVGNERPVLGTPNSAGPNTPISSLTFATNKSTSSLVNSTDLALNYKSDGGRRFFIRYNPNDTSVFSGLRLLPYDAAEWGLNNSGPLADSTLAAVQHMFCMEFISGTGHFFIGTDNGVVSLE